MIAPEQAETDGTSPPVIAVICLGFKLDALTCFQLIQAAACNGRPVELNFLRLTILDNEPMPRSLMSRLMYPKANWCLHTNRVAELTHVVRFTRRDEQQYVNQWLILIVET